MEEDREMDIDWTIAPRSWPRAEESDRDAASDSKNDTRLTTTSKAEESDRDAASDSKNDTRLTTTSKAEESDRDAAWTIPPRSWPRAEESDRDAASDSRKESGEPSVEARERDAALHNPRDILTERGGEGQRSRERLEEGEPRTQIGGERQRRALDHAAIS